MLVELALLDLELRFRAERPVGVADYLEHFPELAHEREAVVSLLAAEYRCRARAGDPAEVLSRFPTYRDEVLARVPTGATLDFTAAPVPPADADLPGHVGRFRVVRRIGAGGMGVVYEALDVALGRPVALKRMKPAQAASPSGRRRFLREAQAVAALDHEHIVPVYEVGEDGGLPFLVMKLLQGETLAARLRRLGPLPVAEAVRIARQIADGLAAAHARGVIHRDSKPANVWLEAEGDRVRILDFGLARAAAASHSTAEGMVLGTPAYMAPEQAAGQTGAHGPGCDVYGLGVILYEMLTGRVPFRGPTADVLRQIVTQPPPRPSAYRPGLDPGLEAICLKALAKEPQDRHAGMAEFAAALHAYQPRPRRRRWPAAVVALFVVSAVLVGVFRPGWRKRGGGEQPDPGAARADEGAGGQEAEPRTAPDLSGRRPLHDDDFRDPESRFLQKAHDQGRCGYADGKYYLATRAGPISVNCPGGRYQNFACQVVGRAARHREDGWSLVVTNQHDNDHSIQVTVTGERTVQVTPSRFEPERGRGPVVGPVPVAKLHAGLKFNTLLVVLRGRLLEVYANGVAACAPIRLDRDLTPAVLALGCVGPPGHEARSEFQRFTVWSAEGLPAPPVPAAAGPPPAEPVGEVRRIGPVPGEVYGLACTPDGERVLTGGSEGVLQWYRHVGGYIGPLKDPPPWVRSLSVSPDGRLAAAGAADSTVRVWDLASGAQVKALKGHTGEVWAVALSPEGRRLLSGGADRTVRLWDVPTGEELARFDKHQSTVWSVAFSSDGQRAISSSGGEHRPGVGWKPGPDNTIRLWDLKDLKARRPLHIFKGHTAHVFRAAFTPDDRLLVSASADGTVCLWDVQKGAPIGALKGQDARGEVLHALAVSPDGRYALTGGWDKTVRLWDIAARRETDSFTGHADLVSAVAFTPDGRYALSGGRDKTVRLWRLPPGPGAAPQPPWAPWADRPFVWMPVDLREGQVRAPRLDRGVKPPVSDNFRDPKKRLLRPHLKGATYELGYEADRYVIRVNSDRERDCARCPCPGEYADVACEVVGRALGQSPEGGWGLYLWGPDRAGPAGRMLEVRLDRAGRVWVRKGLGASPDFKAPAAGPFTHPRIEPGDKFNRLLVILRNRALELYVNGYAVANPIPLPEEIRPVSISLAAISRRVPSRAEFEWLAIYPAERLTPAAALREP